MVCSEIENALFTSYRSVDVSKEDISVYKAYSFIYILALPPTHTRKGSRGQQTTSVCKESSVVKLPFIKIFMYSWLLYMQFSISANENCLGNSCTSHGETLPPYW